MGKAHFTKAFAEVFDKGTCSTHCSSFPAALHFIQSWNLSTKPYLELLNWSEVAVWTQSVKLLGYSRNRRDGSSATAKTVVRQYLVSNSLSLREEYVSSWCDTSATGVVRNRDMSLQRVSPYGVGFYYIHWAALLYHSYLLGTQGMGISAFHCRFLLNVCYLGEERSWCTKSKVALEMGASEAICTVCTIKGPRLLSGAREGLAELMEQEQRLELQAWEGIC